MLNAPRPAGNIADQKDRATDRSIWQRLRARRSLDNRCRFVTSCLDDGQSATRDARRRQAIRYRELSTWPNLGADPLRQEPPTAANVEEPPQTSHQGALSPGVLVRCVRRSLCRL